MIILLKNTYKRGAWFYEKKVLLSACSSTYGRCLYRVPVAEVKAEDGYNSDSYWGDDWYDNDDSPADTVLDLSNVTIDKTSQTGYAQDGYTQTGYSNQDTTGWDSYDQTGYSNQGTTGRDGYDQGNYTQTGYDQTGYNNQGSADQAQNGQSGYDQSYFSDK